MSLVDAVNLYNSWSPQKRKEFDSLIGKSLEESLSPKQSDIDACKKYFEAWKLEHQLARGSMEQTRSHIRKFVVNCLLDNPDSVDNLAIFQDTLKQIANYIIQKYGNDDLLSLINHLIRDGQKDPKIKYKLRQLTTPKA